MKGTSASSDIWSLGCLLFELVSGEYLFADNEWIAFFFRATGKSPLLTKEQHERLERHFGRTVATELDSFLSKIMKQDAAARPTSAQLMEEFRKFRDVLSL